MNENILNVKVGEPLELVLARATRIMEVMERGDAPTTSDYGIGFSNIGQLIAVFTQRRRDLPAVLRESGSMSIATLARLLKRGYKNVHSDIEKLSEWHTVEKDEQNRFFAPYSEIVVDVLMPERRAA